MDKLSHDTYSFLILTHWATIPFLYAMAVMTLQATVFGVLAGAFLLGDATDNNNPSVARSMVAAGAGAGVVAATGAAVGAGGCSVAGGAQAATLTATMAMTARSCSPGMMRILRDGRLPRAAAASDGGDALRGAL